MREMRVVSEPTETKAQMQLQFHCVYRKKKREVRVDSLDEEGNNEVEVQAGICRLEQRPPPASNFGAQQNFCSACALSSFQTRSQPDSAEKRKTMC